jgi:hypothetical protein
MDYKIVCIRALLGFAMWWSAARLHGQGVDMSSKWDGAEQTEGSDWWATAHYNAEGLPPAPGNAGTQELCRGNWSWWCPPAADPLPRYNLVASEAFDTWRSVADGNSRPNGNSGLVETLNMAAPVPWLEEYGVGAQLGMSYGDYNFSGRTSPPGPVTNHETQQQVFVTTGLFRRADANMPISGGLVYDWMANDGFGAFSQSPFLGQWRGQLAYAFASRAEIGMWGTVRDRGSSRDALGAPVQYRAISQGNFFIHWRWNRGCETWAFVGLPDLVRLNGDHAYESTIYGARLNKPLTDRVSFYSNFQAVKFTSGVSTHPAYDFSVGLSFYPNRSARSSTIAGHTWMPYQNVANNGSFLVDASRVQ